MKCTNRLDEDNPESGPCGDEGRMCSACFKTEERYWAGYFGLTPDMSKEEYVRRLGAFRPVGWEPGAD